MKKPPHSHVVLGPRGRLQCMHCGGSHDPFAGGQGVELGLVVGISKTFQKLHRACEATGKPRCYACLKEGHTLEDHVRLMVHTPEAWPGCGDDGLSSTAIWAHMTGRPLPSRDAPVDPDDFGRCSRLLAAPWALGWRARIGEMARYGATWAALAARWEELEALFAAEAPTGRAPKLYEAMKVCRWERW